MDRECPRPRCVPARPMAGYDRAAVLQLSRHGRARHNFYCGDGLGCVDAVAPQTLRFSRDAVGANALRSAAVHREYRGMDDRGARASTLAYLWFDAHRARSLA